MNFPPATCGDGFHCRLLWRLTTSRCVCQSNLSAIVRQSQHSELYDLTSHNASCYDTERVISATTPQPFSMGPPGHAQQTSPQTEISPNLTFWLPIISVSTMLRQWNTAWQHKILWQCCLRLPEEQLKLSNKVVVVYSSIYVYMCMYTHICIHTYTLTII